jgi:Ras-related protein Rab-8A
MFQVVTEQQGQELADELGLRYLETSAKTNINVEEAFFALARSVLSPSSSTPH